MRDVVFSDPGEIHDSEASCHWLVALRSRHRRQDNNSPSAIGIFAGLAVESFPSEPQHFSVLVLTDTQGEGRGKMVVYRLDEHWLRQEEIYATEHVIRFPDRFAVINFNLRVHTIRFPAPASYEFVLFVDQDEVAHRRVRVYQAPPGRFV